MQAPKFLTVLSRLAATAYFFQLVKEVPDGEKDVVATLKAEDAAIVRKARRLMIAKTNQHAAEYYVTFTQILITLVWRPELVK